MTTGLYASRHIAILISKEKVCGKPLMDKKYMSIYMPHCQDKSALDIVRILTDVILVGVGGIVLLTFVLEWESRL